MTISMHALSAPIYVALLTNLNSWLDKAEAVAAEKKFDIEVLLSARLAPDMFDLRRQIHIATGWAKNSQCRLAGENPPDFADTDVTPAQLRARITRAIDIVQSYDAKALDGSETRTITYNLGPEIKMSQSGLDYLTKAALPNFWFHVSAAYAILRHNGVPLGKADFLTGMFTLPGA
jgi:hypothetical protein